MCCESVFWSVFWTVMYVLVLTTLITLATAAFVMNVIDRQRAEEREQERQWRELNAPPEPPRRRRSVNDDLNEWTRRLTEQLDAYNERWR